MHRQTCLNPDVLNVLVCVSVSELKVNASCHIEKGIRTHGALVALQHSQQQKNFKKSFM